MQPRDPQFDTKLLVYRARQAVFAVVIILTIAVFAAYIREGVVEGRSWFVIIFPLSIISLLYILFPPTEQWEYRAWQSKAQKIEQQSSGK